MAEVPRARLLGFRMTFWRWVALANLVVALAVIAYASGKAGRDRAATRKRARAALEGVAKAYGELRACLRGPAKGKSLVDAMQRRLIADPASGEAMGACGTQYAKTVEPRLYAKPGTEAQRAVWKHPWLRHVAATAALSPTGFGKRQTWVTVPYACRHLLALDAALRTATAAFDLHIELPPPLSCWLSLTEAPTLRLPRVLWKESPGLGAAIVRADQSGVLVHVRDGAGQVAVVGAQLPQSLARTRDGRHWDILRLPAGSRTQVWTGSVAWALVFSKHRWRALVHDHRCPGPLCDNSWRASYGHEIRVRPAAGWKQVAELRGTVENPLLLAYGAHAAVIVGRGTKPTMHVLDVGGARLGKPIALGKGAARYLMSEDGGVSAIRLQRVGATVRVTGLDVGSSGRASTTSLELPGANAADLDHLRTRGCAGRSVHWQLINARWLIASKKNGAAWRLVQTKKVTTKFGGVKLRCSDERLSMLIERDDTIWHQRCKPSGCEPMRRLGTGVRAHYAAANPDKVLVELRLDTGYVVDVSSRAPVIERLARVWMTPSEPYVRGWSSTDQVYGGLW